MAAALTALIAACSGPRARASDAHVRPSARPGFYRVEARLANSGGKGQVQLTVRLRNRETGRIVTQDQAVELEPRDQIDVALEVPAPPGHYEVDVAVEYPPR